MFCLKYNKVLLNSSNVESYQKQEVLINIFLKLYLIKFVFFKDIICLTSIINFVADKLFKYVFLN